MLHKLNNSFDKMKNDLKGIDYIVNDSRLLLMNLSYSKIYWVFFCTSVFVKYLNLILLIFSGIDIDKFTSYKYVSVLCC